jgi:ABC-type phosphate transport system substrate-binding protein
MKKLLIALIALVSMQAAHADLVVVANPGVKFSNISLTQLTRIFLGQTRNFPDGNNAVPLDVGGDFRNSFYTYVLKKSPAQVERYWARMIFTGKSQPPREVALKDVKTLVAETSGAISYLDSSVVDSSVKVIKVTED